MTNPLAPKLIIGIGGPANSGKNTVAKIAAQAFEQLGWLTFEDAFAMPMKVFVKSVFQFTDEQMYGPSHMREAPDGRYTRADGVPLTPRHALQTLGTEWGRAMHPTIWTELGIREAKAALANTARVEPQTPLVYFFTDARFETEGRAIRSLDFQSDLAVTGQLWFVQRGERGSSTHPSETEMWGAKYQDMVTHLIRNDQGLEHLKAYIDDVVRMIHAELVGETK